MKINYNVTGSERKALVQVIGQAVREKPVYMKMPTCAYAIGDIIVNRNGEMIWDERTDEATIRRVSEALATAGYTTNDVVAEKAKADGAIQSTEKGAAGGVAELDATGKVPTSQLPAYVSDVYEGYLAGNKNDRDKSICRSE